MQVLQFIGAFVVGAVSIVGVSFLWPRVTTQPRPEVLTKVRDAVFQTETGWELANTLGVADETNAEPINIQEAAASAAQSAAYDVAAYTSRAVTTKLFDSALSRFDLLSKEDQERFREQICVPVEKAE